MSSRKHWLTAKIASEGYCCLNAYLRLCRARGETVKAMAANIQMSPHTIWYHYRKIDAVEICPNAVRCQKRVDCMDAVVTSIEAEVSLKRLLEG